MPAATLATFLRDRRTRLDPATFGLAGRRRTPGLRREEVAQRANISPTWYTWLEQARGGAPSADVLNRIARAMLLTEAEREHMFMLGLGRPPEARYASVEGVSPRLQRFIDRLETCPAVVKTATWEVVAWNRAATLVLSDYGKLPPGERNMLRFVFCNPEVRAKQHDWETIARFCIAAFRADAARAGAVSQIGALVEELCEKSEDFRRIWNDNEISVPGEGAKRLVHPIFGTIDLEFSTFAVDGRVDLNLMVYTPVDPTVADHIRRLVVNGL
ncbi:helix-turn-helix domain-containing protein [Ciceribacter sp. L1K23]|uniref:helix-turn-helix transcriptional regulator n=1 Tax=Ciceribacter sp. L1K23 TaxID=2820276 RepID=UPI001B823E8B|nr:helix-turn-helix transcriptional regulator [Ciceribacter sp. L1K23]MBR0554601.1 helix-turn-helix domain-containing protein [Ciceribacter sp. L1K23]